MKTLFASNTFHMKILRAIVFFALFASMALLAGQGIHPENAGQSLPESQAAATFSLHSNIAYKSGSPAGLYEGERCKLDLYVPDGRKGFATLVWFYGGSLKHGSKEDAPTRAVAERFAREGIGVALVDYRLFPGVKYPGYIDDAAASTAWVLGNIAKYRGDPKAVFIGGHSAGGYLVLMLAMDPSYLKKYGLDPGNVAGVIPVSGQTFTHYTVREERGIPNPENTPVIDGGAPCYHARLETPPVLVVWADGDNPDRIEENRYFAALHKRIGNTHITPMEMKDRNHMTLITKIPEPGDPLAREILSFIAANHK